jgi:TPR repeat protein
MRIITITILFIFFSILQADVFQAQCNEDNATACYSYALPLVSGENAKVQDIKERGMSFMRKACILGEPRACDIMGKNYYKDANYKVAIPYLVNSCKRNIRFACEAMGTIYRDGHDVRADDVKSRLFYEQACELGSPDACFNVAIIYRGGFGVDKNRTKEKEYYKKSCKLGRKAGCDRYEELDNEDKGIKSGFWETISSWFK